MALTPDMNNYDWHFTDGKYFWEDFRKSCHKTIDYCLKNGYKFSCREHVWIYGLKKNEQLDV